MEIRKVQVTGGSSYIITLPKAWVKSVGISKNSPLGLITQSDGTLLITPKLTEEPIQREKEFVADKIDNETYLFRNLIGAYIAGFTLIRLKSNEKLPPFIRAGVRKFTQMTIGQEVVEETNTSILIKDILNPAEMPFDNTIKRMHIIVRGMHEDAISALKNSDKDLAQHVVSRDNDVDRLHWLIARQYNIISRDVKLAEKLGTRGMTINYFFMSKIIERIGDHAVRIAKNVLNIIDKKLDRKAIDTYISASKLALNIFNKSLESFRRRDMKLSNENIESVTKLTSLCKELNTLALQQKGEIAISMGYIIESIRRTGEYSGDLSEDVIDYLMGYET